MDSALNMDHWVKVLSSHGTLRATCVRATELVDETRQRHNLSDPRSIRALGEALLASLLLSSRRKSGEKISLSIKGDGFLRQAVADADPSGTVRGFITTRETHSEIDPKEVAINKSFGIGPWGEGLISVVTLLQNEKEPYVGTCSLATGHLAKDLTLYLTQSEQIPSAVGIAVRLQDSGKVASAAAFLIEVMPGAEEKDVAFVEQALGSFQHWQDRLTQEDDPKRILSQIFNQTGFTILDSKPVFFSCNCSRDRVERALGLLSQDDLQAMMTEDHGAEVGCDFCNRQYQFSEDQLQALMTKRGQK